MVFIKRLGTTLSGTADWVVYHAGMGSASKHFRIKYNSGRESTDNGMFNGATQHQAFLLFR